MTKDERSTADPVPAEQLRDDVACVMDTLANGGVALVPLDVAYAIIASSRAGIAKIFAAKARSYDKPSGMFANRRLSAEIHIMDDDRREIVRTLAEDVGVPFSVVAPFRADHPLLAAADPFVLDTSSKAGTLDMLMNAGLFHDELARQSIERGLAVFGSSANTSLGGSKYRLSEVDAPVREAADIAFDYGRSKYANTEGRSSTIIDFRDFSIVRVGVEFDVLQAAFKQRFNIALAS